MTTPGFRNDIRDDIRAAYANGCHIEMIRIAFEVDRATIMAALIGGSKHRRDRLQDRIDLRLADDPAAAPLWLGEATADVEPAGLPTCD